jgi:NADPH-dependent 2,4-dienoyl-CoA reductase/sulfur reductase-like enzyme/rhodanese-related sulfurtransferase
VGNVIQSESSLLLATPELFRERFNIDVRIRNEALAIIRAASTILVRDLETGREYSEPYDALVLSPGAAPICPPWPGIDLPGIFSLRTIPDSREIRNWIKDKKPRKAVVVGGGFIGLEMAENLAHRDISVTIVEMADQVMPPLDPEMAQYAKERLETRRVTLALADAVAEFGQGTDGKLKVHTKGGKTYEADLVVLAIGVRPETKLALQAGLELGERGGIRTDSQMRTSDPRIWAVGDAVEVRNRITGQWELVPLAGPANRQGRIAADVICGRDAHFGDVQGTAVCGFFDFTVALTGATEKSLRRAKIDDYQCIYLHPGNHVGYYPGASPIHMKLIFRKSDGIVLGAQAAGTKGVERRIDVIATAIQMKSTVFDLEEAELCYAPQYGAAKDPVNMAGMIAANVLRGDVQLAPWNELESTDAFLLDVREPDEFCADAISGSENIPLSQLRARLGELPQSREIWVNCGVGLRSYYACRILVQHGFRARYLSGGFGTYCVMHR